MNTNHQNKDEPNLFLVSAAIVIARIRVDESACLEVLTMKHRKHDRRGVPAGCMLHTDKDITAGMQRELYEELGVFIDESDLLALQSTRVRRYKAQNSLGYDMYLENALIYIGNGELWNITEPDKLSDLRWEDPDVIMSQPEDYTGITVWLLTQVPRQFMIKAALRTHIRTKMEDSEEFAFF